MFILLPLLFVGGIVAIALEDKIKVNKAAVALVMGISLWMILMLDAYNIFVDRPNVAFTEFLENNPEIAAMSMRNQFVHFITNHSIINDLGNIAETLFFIMTAMLIVDLVDKHGGFMPISRLIATTNKRRLLWTISIATFLCAPLLDNMAAAIVLLAILRKLVIERTDRIKYACMIIIAANAGGCFSPIGDVTTILLWMGKNIAPIYQITHVFLPALVCLLVPLTVATFWLFKKGDTLQEPDTNNENKEILPPLPNASRWIILTIGVLSLVFVPLFQSLTDLPPFLGALLGLCILWFYTDIQYSRLKNVPESQKMRIINLLPNVDLSTIFFFLGILMSIGALETSGHLAIMSGFLDTYIHQPYLISFAIGIMSSFIDNVALVAATIGMYPLQTGELDVYAQYFATNGGFWTSLAYSGVTGGSILIIGSATGVIVMGMEKISFSYYAKRFTILALLGYIAGAITYYLIFR